MNKNMNVKELQQENIIKMENGYLKYSKFPMEFIKQLGVDAQFCLQDICETVEDLNLEELKKIDVIVINYLWVDKDYRNKDIGTNLLKKITEDNNNSLIVACSAALMEEYPTEPTTEEFNQILDRLNNYFTKRNFINVNRKYGCYEFKETFLFNNKLAQELL